jgi:hypothetical protein
MTLLYEIQACFARGGVETISFFKLFLSCIEKLADHSDRAV